MGDTEKSLNFNWSLIESKQKIGQLLYWSQSYPHSYVSISQTLRSVVFSNHRASEWFYFAYAFLLTSRTNSCSSKFIDTSITRHEYKRRFQVSHTTSFHWLSSVELSVWQLISQPGSASAGTYENNRRRHGKPALSQFTRADGDIHFVRRASTIWRYSFVQQTDTDDWVNLQEWS